MLCTLVSWWCWGSNSVRHFQQVMADKLYTCCSNFQKFKATASHRIHEAAACRKFFEWETLAWRRRCWDTLCINIPSFDIWGAVVSVRVSQGQLVCVVGQNCTCILSTRSTFCSAKLQTKVLHWTSCSTLKFVGLSGRGSVCILLSPCFIGINTL